MITVDRSTILKQIDRLGKQCITCPDKPGDGSVTNIKCTTECATGIEIGRLGDQLGHNTLLQRQSRSLSKLSKPTITLNIPVLPISAMEHNKHLRRLKVDADSINSIDVERVTNEALELLQCIISVLHFKSQDMSIDKLQAQIDKQQRKFIREWGSGK